MRSKSSTFKSDVEAFAWRSMLAETGSAFVCVCTRAAAANCKTRGLSQAKLASCGQSANSVWRKARMSSKMSCPFARTKTSDARPDTERTHSRRHGAETDDRRRPAARACLDRRAALAAPPRGLGPGLRPCRGHRCRARWRTGRHRAALALGRAPRHHRPRDRVAGLPGAPPRPPADERAARRARGLHGAAARHRRRAGPLRTPGLRAHRRAAAAPGRGPAGAAGRAADRLAPAAGRPERGCVAAGARRRGTRHAARCADRGPACRVRCLRGARPRQRAARLRDAAPLRTRARDRPGGGARCRKARRR